MAFLSGRRILIAGLRNRRSLAHAVAASCAREGAKLAFAVQPGGKALEKAAAIVREDFAPDAPVIACDAASDSDIAETVRAAAKHFGGKLDGIVHAIAFAQMETLRGPYHENATRAAFAEALDISAYTFTAFLRAAEQADAWGNRNGGENADAENADAAAVTLTYLGGERAMPSYNLMGVAKAALESSVRYLALGMGPRGARVNAVSAGPVKTLAAAAIGDFGKILRQVENQAPLRRNISAAEVGDAAAFLLSPLARGITGEVLHVDAGFHATAVGQAEPENKSG